MCKGLHEGELSTSSCSRWIVQYATDNPKCARPNRVGRCFIGIKLDVCCFCRGSCY